MLGKAERPRSNFLANITDKRAQDTQIRSLAFHDTLAKLPNRRLLLAHLDMAMARNERTGQHSAVLFMDLDNFKPLNDLHGHAAGDMLLVEVAEGLQQNIRSKDTAARLGVMSWWCCSMVWSQIPTRPRSKLPRWPTSVWPRCRSPAACEWRHQCWGRGGWITTAPRVCVCWRGMGVPLKRCWITPLRPCTRPNRLGATRRKFFSPLRRAEPGRGHPQCPSASKP